MRLFTESLKDDADKAAESAAFDVLFPKDTDSESKSLVAKIQKELGVRDPDKLFEWTRMCAEETPNYVPLYIENFGIVDQDKRYELAKICIEKNTKHAIENFKRFGIQGQNRRFELALRCAEKEPDKTADYIEFFGIEDQDKRFELAKICAREKPGSLGPFVKNFGILDQDRLFELAKICAREEPECCLICVKNFGITDQGRLFEIARICAEKAPGNTVLYIEMFGIKDPDRRFELAMICAEKAPKLIAIYIKKFGIQDQNKLFEFAMICAEKVPGDIVLRIENFGIKDPDRRFELARICAVKMPRETSMHIENFDIQDQDRHFELAKLLAKRVPFDLNYMIWPFNLNAAQTKSIFMTMLQYEPRVLLKLEKNHSEFKDLNLDSIDAETSINGLQQFNESHLKSGLCGLITFLQKNELNTNEWAPSIGSAFYIVRDALDNKLITIDKLPTIEMLLLQAMKFPIPYLRAPLFRSVIAFVRSPRACDIYAEISNNKLEKYPSGKLLRSLVVTLEDQDLAKTIIDSCNSAFNTLKDTKKSAVLLDVIDKIQEADFLTVEEKKKVLKQIFIYKNKQLVKQLYAVSSIFSFQEESLLKSWKEESGDFSKCAENIFKEKVEIEHIENLSEKYSKKFARCRHPQALVVYAAKMKSLNDSAIMRSIGRFVASVLEDKFKEERYDLSNSPHLTHLFGEEKNAEIFKKWQEGSSREFLIDGSKEIKERQLGCDLLWLRTKLVTDKHMDLSFLNELKDYLTNPEKIKKVRESLAEKLPSPQILFQKLCLDLISETTNDGKLQVLKELKGLLIKDFPGQEFLNDVKGIIENFQKSEVRSSKFTVTDTDDPIDLLLCGTEVTGSCQRVEGNPDLNKGLLGYLLDGKNRLIAVKDQNGKIVARSLLKLLCDGEIPVLFLERAYMNDGRANYSRLIRNAALQKANRLGIQLTSLDIEGDIYPNPLESLGGPAPFEYSDASRGLQANGVYKIEKVFSLLA